MKICDDVMPPMIVSHDTEYVKDPWFYTNKKFNNDDAIDLSTFLAYRSSSELNKSLKCLYFKGIYADFEQLNLNDFVELEQLTLKIDLNGYADDSKLVHINLPNLRILEVFRSGIGLHFNLKAPRLEKLKCLDFTAISVPDTNVVNHLEQNFEPLNDEESIWPMKNVQCWKVNCIPPFLETVLAFPALTTLFCSEPRYMERPEYLTTDILSDFVHHKANRPEFKVCFQSVDLIDHQKIEDYKAAGNILAFQIKNYDLLCGDTPTSIEYNELIRLCNGTLPDDFHQKFKKINSVKVAGEVANYNNFVAFLRNLNCVTSLSLEQTSFNQTFYEQLPEFCQLHALFINNCTFEITDWNFLLQMKLLRRFATDHSSIGKVDVVARLFKQLKHFERGHFAVDRVTLSKRPDKLVRFMRKTSDLLELFNVDVNHLECVIAAYKSFVDHAVSPPTEAFVDSEWMPEDLPIEKKYTVFKGQRMQRM